MAETGDLFGALSETPTPKTPIPQFGLLATVAVARPLDHPLDYLVPESLVDKLQVGQQVSVPLGPRSVMGFVVKIAKDAPLGPAMKPILRIDRPTPLLTRTTLDLGLWVARYYGAAPGEALRAVVPAPVRHHRRQRQEAYGVLEDPQAAREVVEERAGQQAWAARRRVLRLLLEHGGPVPLREIQGHAQVSDSPVKTLIRSGLVTLVHRDAGPDPFADLQPDRTPPPELTTHQQQALSALLPLVEGGIPGRALLHGVTGSGKTEVYLRLLEAVARKGRGAILLVPEIALTPQTVERLTGRLKDVAVLHSALSDGARAHQWERLRTGETRVAVGPRSAIFAPIPDVGLIILDEEHETTFKQNQTPRYHARDVAQKRAELEGALLLLGTATPSMEAELSCRKSRESTSPGMMRLSLPARVASRPLPTCVVLDMRNEKAVGAGRMFSRPLLTATTQALNAGNQVLFFLNRRGFSTHVLCRQCGWKAGCPRCDISLTHYRGSERLLCHHCNYERPPPDKCPDCGSHGVLFEGAGTERVAETAQRLFPHARVERMDGETLRRRGAANRIFQDLKSGAIDILVGTQVVAKGLDIPGISLVGVISADTALLVPDFRSAERTFQLLCQVAGRAGRGDSPGKVLIQTWSPAHYAIVAAAQHDHGLFVEEELQHRKAMNYPPFGHLARVVVEGPKPEEVLAWTTTLGQTLGKTEPVAAGTINILGPAPCPIAIIRDMHRYHVLIHSQSAEALTAILPAIPRRAPRQMKVLLDRDPVSLM